MRIFSRNSTNLKIIKLFFRSPVHFGKGKMETTARTILADTIFSAIFLQMLRSPDGVDTSDQLVEAVRKGDLRISDTNPFIGDTLYLPKPMQRIQSEERADAKAKKEFKKLEYIPIDSFDAYLEGRIDAKNENRMFSSLGEYESQDKVRIQDDEDNTLYRLATYRFREGCGLYFIVSCSDHELLDSIVEVVEDIGIVGIGGKTNIGMGAFDITTSDAKLEVVNADTDTDTNWMMLSFGFPKSHEITPALDSAECKVVKRTGFVRSQTYSDRPFRKKDFYGYQAGSCFPIPFEGDVFDVGNGGNHPVYRYAAPLWLEVKRK